MPKPVQERAHCCRKPRPLGQPCCAATQLAPQPSFAEGRGGRQLLTATRQKGIGNYRASECAPPSIPICRQSRLALQ
eukprot:1177231-Pyramimonas_sp.AAC.1